MRFALDMMDDQDIRGMFTAIQRMPAHHAHEVIGEKVKFDRLPLWIRCRVRYLGERKT